MTNQEKSVNQVAVSGTLQNPILRYTTAGDAVSNASLELIDAWKDGKAKKQWVRVVLWRGLAERAAEFQKDAKVRITGRLETASWVDKTSGEKKYRNQIVADSLEPIQSLGEIPSPKAPKEKTSSRIGGTEHARAILKPASSAVTAANPITDEDIPF